MLYRKFCSGNNVLFLEKLAIFGKMGRMGSGSGRIIESMILIYMYGFITHLKHVVKYSTLVN